MLWIYYVMVNFEYVEIMVVCVLKSCICMLWWLLLKGKEWYFWLVVFIWELFLKLKKNWKKICGCFIEFLVVIINGYLVIKVYENYDLYFVIIMKLLY